MLHGNEKMCPMHDDIPHMNSTGLQVARDLVMIHSHLHQLLHDQNESVNFDKLLFI